MDLLAALRLRFPRLPLDYAWDKQGKARDKRGRRDRAHPDLSGFDKLTTSFGLRMAENEQGSRGEWETRRGGERLEERKEFRIKFLFKDCYNSIVF